MAAVHDAASTGYAGGADAYVRGRPSYPDAAVDLARRLAARGRIVDVGAGTGAFAALLGGELVVAVDPVHAMLARVPAAIPTVRATADALPVRDGAAALVTAATAFHWFATDAALAAFARVLAADGHLLLLWNVRDETVPWVAAHTALVDRHAGDAPRYATFEWRRAIDASDRFEVVEEHEVANPTPMTGARLVDRILSTSFVAALPDDERVEVAAEAAEIAAGLPPTFDYPYVTRSLVLRPR